MPVQLHEGDCLDVLKSLRDASIDSVVTDPPYGLSREPDINEVLRHWIAGDDYTHTGNGFMGRTWDSFVPGPSVWREVLRVLKPGGHILCFAGTRTQDLMGIALRMAGFEIRDCIRYEQGQQAWPGWLYGQGFPKSTDIAHAIDKSGGNGGMAQHERVAFASELTVCRAAAGMSRAALAALFPQYREVTKNWERTDAGFRIPTEADFTILADRLGMNEAWRSKLRAEDKRRLLDQGGTDRRGDGSVYGLAHSGKVFEATTDAAKRWKGWGTALKPAWEPVIVARKPLVGTAAQNVLQYGTGAINIDACRLPMGDEYDPDATVTQRTNRNTWEGGKHSGFSADHFQAKFNAQGRWPANVIHDGSDEVEAAFAAFGKDKGGSAPASGTTLRDGNTSVARGRYNGLPEGVEPPFYGDTGSASRFFYCAKASKAERDGTDHPTVKPAALMAYLCRLVTPPGGTVLDPFAGSGSTAQGALDGGFEAVLVEREAAYCEHIRYRFALFMDDTNNTVK